MCREALSLCLQHLQQQHQTTSRIHIPLSVLLYQPTAWEDFERIPADERTNGAVHHVAALTVQHPTPRGSRATHTRPARADLGTEPRTHARTDRRTDGGRNRLQMYRIHASEDLVRTKSLPNVLNPHWRGADEDEIAPKCTEPTASCRNSFEHR